MAIVDELTAQITQAQKERDAVRRDALRLIRDALQKELKDSGSVDEVAVLKRERKRRLQSAEVYARMAAPIWLMPSRARPI